MIVRIKFKFLVKLDVDFFINNFFIFIKGKNGIVKIFLPNYYFFKKDNNKFFFNFLNKNYYNLIIKQLFLNLKLFYKFFYIRLKLKGLGYRIRRYMQYLFRFFIGYNHYFYFFVPLNTFI